MQVLMDFQDRAIRLTDERRRHIAGPADPRGVVQAIRDTLQHPDEMQEAFRHPQMRLFYRLYSHRMEDDRVFYVVVKVRGYDMLVVTAFYGRNFSWGGARWKV
ncbi:MAG: hypothetical protein C4524_09470 [Candidatus Zixiibacteriota bacterium]|nr:MAG: hypothetical protein C4524_09470 [candidate division Zixibacteria bacterium]